MSLLFCISNGIAKIRLDKQMIKCIIVEFRFFVFDVSKIYLVTTFVQKKSTNDRKILNLIILM